MNTSANNISLHNNNVTSTSPVFLEFKMLYNFMFCVKFLITFNVFVISMYFKYVFVFFGFYLHKYMKATFIAILARTANHDFLHKPFTSYLLLKLFVN